MKKTVTSSLVFFLCAVLILLSGGCAKAPEISPDGDDSVGYVIHKMDVRIIERESDDTVKVEVLASTCDSVEEGSTVSLRLSDDPDSLFPDMETHDLYRLSFPAGFTQPLSVTDVLAIDENGDPLSSAEA